MMRFDVTGCYDGFMNTSPQLPAWRLAVCQVIDGENVKFIVMSPHLQLHWAYASDMSPDTHIFFGPQPYPEATQEEVISTIRAYLRRVAAS